MPIETIDEKAARLYTAGAVHFDEALDGGIDAYLVDGDHATYQVLLSDSLGDGSCTCPAMTSCAHVAAASIHRAYRRGEDSDLQEGGHQDQGHPQPEDIEDKSGLAVPDDPALLDLAEAPVTWRTLEALSRTEFVPKQLTGRPAAVLGAVLMGRDYGLGPLEALRLIDVIDGSPEPNAELKGRLYRLAGHRLEVLELTDQICKLRGTRGDTAEKMTVTYTIFDAEQAGLTGKSNWQKSPTDMLFARAVTRLVRRLAPDALHRADR